jgi:hypothetical protein
MAKASTPAKKKTSEAPKKAPLKKKATAVAQLDAISEQALIVLQKLNIETKLCNDIEWCLGSYRHDHNPTGLLETAAKALSVLQEAKVKNAKAVPAKLLTDLQKALK